MNVRGYTAPKYYRIYEELLEEIKSGRYKEGDRFPSDTDLVARFDVSRGTIREALKLLLQQGYLEREQGKGTFVRFRKIEQDPEKLIGFTELMRRNHLEPSGKIIEKSVETIPSALAAELDVERNRKVVRFFRVRYGDDQPLIIERSFFDYQLFKPVMELDLEHNSIFELLYKYTDTRLGKATQRIEAITAGADENRYLNVEIGTPLLLITRIIETDEGSFFQYSEDVYRSDRISFTTHTAPYEKNHDALGLPIDLED